MKRETPQHLRLGCRRPIVVSGVMTYPQRGRRADWSCALVSEDCNKTLFLKVLTFHVMVDKSNVLTRNLKRSFFPCNFISRGQDMCVTNGLLLVIMSINCPEHRPHPAHCMFVASFVLHHIISQAFLSLSSGLFPAQSHTQLVCTHLGFCKQIPSAPCRVLGARDEWMRVEC